MYQGHKLLIANRGEIAVRIIRTAKELGLPTVAIYTPSDALSLHVSLADESVALNLSEIPGESEHKAYLSGPSILTICQDRAVTLLHPGYGFLSENAEFASLVTKAGITWLGPRPEVIRMMGLKHEARLVASRAGVPIVPGSPGLLSTVDEALFIATQIGFPVILKATAGGGGMGLVICKDEQEVKDTFTSTQNRVKILFHEDGLFLEQYFPASRHIEIQLFGNGLGDVVHMGERECSVQRRHQKIIEEAPSPFAKSHPGLVEKMCDAALRLCRSIKYGSAGTVEFLVDDYTADFFFLEMNTRIQVEHPITEATHPGLDLVKLMIYQGFCERQTPGIGQGIRSDEPEMQQSTYTALRSHTRGLHAIEGRIYAENPSEAFIPSPGLLQYVELNSDSFDWLRVDSWVSTGITITPFFDGLLCKIIVTGRSREEAISRFSEALETCKIQGPPNNLEYLQAITKNNTFRIGRATTAFLANLDFTPHAMKLLSTGIETTIQDLPGRKLGLGIPRGGPMDSLALSAGNILVGNPTTVEGLEIIIVPGIRFEVEFFIPAVVAITGKDVSIKVDNQYMDMWTRIIVPRGRKLRLDLELNDGTPSPGFRVYLCIRGGFPSVPTYLGSKSTSMGLGGYQGRPLLTGDQLALGECGPEPADQLRPASLPQSLIPSYPLDWVIHVIAGPQDDDEFITPDGRRAFYETKWLVSLASNRLGIRLESSDKIQWARSNGGQGGSHPSNILDNGYAPGTININGDTPVILAKNGPDMGGYLSMCTIVSGDQWKLGQLQPGSTVRFRRISWAQSSVIKAESTVWFASVLGSLNSPTTYHLNDHSPWLLTFEDAGSPMSSILHDEGNDKSRVVFRQAGDSAILVDFGSMSLDLEVRARIHAFESILNTENSGSFTLLCPCVRSIMCHYNTEFIDQDAFLSLLVAANRALPKDLTEISFTGRKITFPIVLDDPWNRDALARYMSTTRNKAVYLPSNIEYLARNNGLAGGAEEALERLIGSDWLVLGVGFYLACPFLVPIDPRCRLVGQKMNPSRTFTPRGAIGIAGPVAAIYPVESPGGYQLYGRTLPTWQTWGKGKDFSAKRPWLLQPFDQIHFEPITSDEYIQHEKDFDAGQYSFKKIEPTTFSMLDHAKFLESIATGIIIFQKGQEQGSTQEEQREKEYLREWEVQKQTSVRSMDEEADDEISRANLDKVTASLFATVWKIIFRPGDVVHSADDILLIFEAMKTEIPVRAGENNVGKTIKYLGKGITEGVQVRPGDVLLFLM